MAKSHERIREDARYLNDHMLWPQMVLPIVNRSNREPGKSTAYLINGAKYTDGKPTIYYGNIFGGIDPQKDPSETFESVDALLAAGWEVD